LEQFSEGEQLVANKRSFDIRSAGTKYSKRGSIQRGVVVSSVIEGDVAVAVSCEQNDVQVWDGKGTTDTTDDVLLDDSVTLEKKQYSLRKWGESWKISASQFTEGDCSAAFS
jgi:hypothetical protein